MPARADFAAAQTFSGQLLKRLAVVLEFQSLLLPSEEETNKLLESLPQTDFSLQTVDASIRLGFEAIVQA